MKRLMVELLNLETRVSIIEESYISKNNIYFEENDCNIKIERYLSEYF